MIRAVIFDADDTLWATEPLYDAALDLAQAEVERAGVDGDEWRKRQRAIDIEAAKVAGFSSSRFPTSSVSAYEQLAPDHDLDVAQRVQRASESVFEAKAPLFPGVRSVLDQLRPDHLLALVTKGDREVQHKRIADSGLVDYFDLVAVVDRKRPQTFAACCELLDTSPSDTASVGNSLRSDILPALEAGLHGVWVEAYVWEHERHRVADLPERAIELLEIADLPSTLAEIATRVPTR